jgi:hypothetical protein
VARRVMLTISYSLSSNTRGLEALWSFWARERRSGVGETSSWQGSIILATASQPIQRGQTDRMGADNGLHDPPTPSIMAA